MGADDDVLGAGPLERLGELLACWLLAFLTWVLGPEGVEEIMLGWSWIFRDDERELFAVDSIRVSDGGMVYFPFPCSLSSD